MQPLNSCRPLLCNRSKSSNVWKTSFEGWWMEANMIMPCLLVISFNLDIMAKAVDESSPDVGSSSSRIAGWMTSWVAIPNRFCSPLDSLASPPHADPILLFEVFVVKSRSRSSFEISARRSVLPFADGTARRCANARVSLTESEPMRGMSSSRYAESLRKRCRSREFRTVLKPSSRISPALGAILWPRTLSRVDLPAPLR